MKPIKVGKFRQRFQLQAPATPETFDSFGQPVPTYTVIGTFWGELVPLQGYEAVKAKHVYAEATHAVSMRWLGAAIDLNPLNRLIRTEGSSTRIFGIINVNDVETRHRLYTLVVQEIQQTGQV